MTAQKNDAWVAVLRDLADRIEAAAVVKAPASDTFGDIAQESSLDLPGKVSLAAAMIRAHSDCLGVSADQIAAVLDEAAGRLAREWLNELLARNSGLLDPHGLNHVENAEKARMLTELVHAQLACP